MMDVLGADATVLVIDDTPDHIAVAVASLEYHGYRVVVAEDGHSGLQRAEEIQPDIILLDLQLPDLHGFEVCKVLKSQDSTQRIPVIFMSADTEIESKVGGFQAGAVDYVTKPVQMDELMARVSTHLNLSALKKRVDAQNRELRQHKQGLERLIDERTAELSASNSQLRREIDERQHIQERLADSEKKFRTLVENSPDVIVRYDRECRRVYVNPAYLRMAGVDGQLAIGKTPAEFSMTQDKAESYQAMLNYVMDNAIDSDMQLEWPMPDGRLVHQHLRMVPEFDGVKDVSGVMVIGRDVTIAKESELRLKELSAQLRELAARNETVREAERKRIAREIHDELGQMLNAMRLNVLSLDYEFGADIPALHDKTDYILKSLDRTISMVRDIVSALHPSVLSAGIISALDWLTLEFSKNTGIACNLLSEQDVSLNEAQVTAIFRIVQESLTNVVRHSGAHLVEISLALVRNGEAYLLEVSDNGRGFDVDQPRKQKSLGLVGMQERAVMLGGSLEVSSMPGKGTTLQVHIPINMKE